VICEVAFAGATGHRTFFTIYEYHEGMEALTEACARRRVGGGAACLGARARSRAPSPARSVEAIVICEGAFAGRGSGHRTLFTIYEYHGGREALTEACARESAGGGAACLGARTHALAPPPPRSVDAIVICEGAFAGATGPRTFFTIYEYHEGMEALTEACARRCVGGGAACLGA
jgi:hypothetical protein